MQEGLKEDVEATMALEHSNGWYVAIIYQEFGSKILAVADSAAFLDPDSNHRTDWPIWKQHERYVGTYVNDKCGCGW